MHTQDRPLTSMTTVQDYAAAGVPARQLGRSFREWNQDDIRTILSRFNVYHKNRRGVRGQNKLEMLRKLDGVIKEHNLSEGDAILILNGRGLDRPVSSKKPTKTFSTSSQSNPPQVPGYGTRLHIHRIRRPRVPRRLLGEAQTARNSIPRRSQPVNAAVPEQTLPGVVSRDDNALFGSANRNVTGPDSTISSNAFEAIHTTPSERECTVCMEALSLSNFPARNITSSCNHEPDICAPCLSQSIATQFTTKAWNNIGCPTCSQRLSYADVKKYADNATFEKYISTSKHLLQVELIVTIDMIVFRSKLAWVKPKKHNFNAAVCLNAIPDTTASQKSTAT